MRNILNTEDILNSLVSGFHQYILTDPPHLNYVSENLLKMLGTSKEELLSETKDLYVNFIHPNDREIYSEFINNLKSKEQTLSLQYRLVKKNGEIFRVKDSMTSKKLNENILVGYSVLTDITDIKNNGDDIDFLAETIPCGFLKFTCEKRPKIIYINKQMINILNIPETKDGELDYLELYKDDMFLMIPMEERRRFSLYLNQIQSSDSPTSGEITLLRCDGTKAYVFGWVTKHINDKGKEEFHAFCFDVTEKRIEKKEQETKRYLKALSEVYDKIFEYNFETDTVRCLYGQNSPRFKWIENIPMQMEDATNRWIDATVEEEDREKVKAFFKDFYKNDLYKSGERPPQITYKARSSSGQIRLYSGIFLKTDDSVSLYCCRLIPDNGETAALRTENISLKENIHELVTRFTYGIAAFEINKDDFITPLYASDNICGFFGLTKEEWLVFMKTKTPLKTFTARSKASYEDFIRLLENGEAEFTYYDFKSEKKRRVKAICSQKSRGTSPRYVMLYNIENITSEENEAFRQTPSVFVRTFGYFDVFVNDIPIAFRNKKAKELLAILVDRRGGYVSSEEAIGFLWEDEPVNPLTLARYRKVALRLKNTLEEYGISDIIESVDGKRRVITKKIRCDLYDYLSEKEEYSQLFKGNYLTNYSWAETTLAELTGNIYNKGSQ